MCENTMFVYIKLSTNDVSTEYLSALAAKVPGFSGIEIGEDLNVSSTEIVINNLCPGAILVPAFDTSEEKAATLANMLPANIFLGISAELPLNVGVAAAKGMHAVRSVYFEKDITAQVAKSILSVLPEGCCISFEDGTPLQTVQIIASSLNKNSMLLLPTMSTEDVVEVSKSMKPGSIFYITSNMSLECIIKSLQVLPKDCSSLYCEDVPQEVQNQVLNSRSLSPDSSSSSALSSTSSISSCQSSTSLIQGSATSSSSSPGSVSFFSQPNLSLFDITLLCQDSTSSVKSNSPFLNGSYLVNCSTPIFTSSAFSSKNDAYPFTSSALLCSSSSSQSQSNTPFSPGYSPLSSSSQLHVSTPVFPSSTYLSSTSEDLFLSEELLSRSIFTQRRTAPLSEDTPVETMISFIKKLNKNNVTIPPSSSSSSSSQCTTPLSQHGQFFSQNKRKHESESPDTEQENKSKRQKI